MLVNRTIVYNFCELAEDLHTLTETSTVLSVIRKSCGPLAVPDSSGDTKTTGSNWVTKKILLAWLPAGPNTACCGEGMGLATQRKAQK